MDVRELQGYGYFEGEPEVAGTIFGVRQHPKAEHCIMLCLEDDGNWFAEMSFDKSWLLDIQRTINEAVEHFDAKGAQERVRAKMREIALQQSTGREPHMNGC